MLNCFYTSFYIFLVFGAFLFSGCDISLNAPINSSYYLVDNPPTFAVDGDDGTLWNAGKTAPRSIVIDLGDGATIEEISLLIVQNPPGYTEHSLATLKTYDGCRSKLDGWNNIYQFKGNTSDNQWLTYKPETPIQNIRYLKISTGKSPSWVGWREIKVKGKNTNIYDGHLKYFGYYWGAVAGQDNYMGAFADHCDFVMIGGINLQEKIIEAKQRGMKTILYSDVCYDHTVRKLRNNYLDIWNQYAAKLNEVMPGYSERYIDNVLAFYPIDEPHNYGYREADLNTVNNLIHSSFPEKPIMLTYAHDKVTKRMIIPSSYDWIGFDYYTTNFCSFYDKYKILKSKINANQLLYLIPDAYEPDTDSISIQDQYNKVEMARKYYHVAKTDSKIILLMPFIWQSFDGNIGTEKMPILHKEFMRISNEIRIVRDNQAVDRTYISY